MVIGCMEQDSDLHFYLTADEVGRLRDERITGVFVNLNNPGIRGKLEIMVNDLSQEIISTLQHGEAGKTTYILVQLKNNRYEQLVRDGSTGDHQGYRNIEISNINRVDFLKKAHYEKIERIAEHYSG